MDFSLQSHASFIGRPASDLPTPSLILSKPVLERNINRLQQDVQELGLSFRPHVKTLKSLEITRLMLSNGLHRNLIVSTLSELRGVLPLAEEGILKEALYGLPIYPSALPHLHSIRQSHPSLTLLLMVDSPQHIPIIEAFNNSIPEGIPPWPVFIKLDVGSRRAGVDVYSPDSGSELEELVQAVEASTVVELYGFYCHAGHSYSTKGEEEAGRVLGSEVSGVLRGVKLIARGEEEKRRRIVLSIGSTPTAHVVRQVKKYLTEEGNVNSGIDVEVEVHAGNYPTNDLQQLSTDLITPADLAVRVLAEVCSVYPRRNEALINAGTVALSKETSAVPGFGRLVEKPEWGVVRMSQEHGIVGLLSGDGAGKVEEVFRVGQKVMLHCQHACITAAQHFVYYVVDEEDVVRETWVPWKGW
ncbi:hypothetical protein AbraIFM66951_003853 [Aspergillus brasiliensis]|uniref:D-serine dehydratase n=1 Tax=Aspergillus brasiliensis TaxID=319629 RepID=A0A9W5Z3C9_9EURO|nr:hypothetical protein AbraCBS73388_003251 [Aspergillus brasiliensis]GKZ50591.1 hypothetical protein AbraIFM66951_003853 [Aspergillus brasiliensis]